MKNPLKGEMPAAYSPPWRVILPSSVGKRSFIGAVEKTLVGRMAFTPLTRGARGGWFPAEGGRAGRVKYYSLRLPPILPCHERSLPGRVRPPTPLVRGAFSTTPHHSRLTRDDTPPSSRVGASAVSRESRGASGARRRGAPFDTPPSAATQGEVDTVAMQDEGLTRPMRSVPTEKGVSSDREGRNCICARSQGRIFQQPPQGGSEIKLSKDSALSRRSTEFE